MLNWLGYMLVIYGPLWPFASADNAIGNWCLPRAGAWAYRRPHERKATP